MLLHGYARCEVTYCINTCYNVTYFWLNICRVLCVKVVGATLSEGVLVLPLVTYCNDIL